MELNRGAPGSETEIMHEQEPDSRPGNLWPAISLSVSGGNVELLTWWEPCGRDKAWASQVLVVKVADGARGGGRETLL